MTKNNKLLLGILAFIVTLTIGYAVFTQTVTVTGTATSNGTFNMIISSATVIEQVGSSGATVSISGDKQTMSINIPKLEYPGAYVIIDYTIKNMGSINSLFTGIETIGADYYRTSGSTKAVRVQPAVRDNAVYSTANSSAFNLADFNKYFFEPNDSVNKKMAIYWKSTENITSAESANITVSFKFEQVVDKAEACEKYTEVMNEFVSYNKGYSSCPYDFNLDGIMNGQDVQASVDAQKLICS